MTHLEKKDPSFCENMPIAGGVTKGNWTNPVYELFSIEEDGPAIHIHIYQDEERVLNTVLPDSVVSYSLSKEN